jgi:hypothetical protein
MAMTLSTLGKMTALVFTSGHPFNSEMSSASNCSTKWAMTSQATSQVLRQRQPLETLWVKLRSFCRGQITTLTFTQTSRRISLCN